ncbi:MAG TPA: ABC transporter permease [Vicinamibacterales bacterium]|nr:ABC transporter permease [Vicinamibacterales bacterium]
MIGTLLRIGWINLKRDRVVQAMTFALPIIFFSIFASVFGNQRPATRQVRMAIVDEDQSAYSAKLVKALQAERALAVQTTANADGTGETLDRAAAESLVKTGTLPVAIVLPKDLRKVQVLADVSDPIAPQIAQGLLQKVSFTARFDALPGGPNAAAFIGLPTEVVNVMKPGQGQGATISFYAAGVGVMFLLFSCSGAGGALLEEEEAGTLGRLIGSRAGMTGVLVGKWLFLALMGVAQICVMFSWGALAFHLPLASHLAGFLIVTVPTAAAAAAFGLFLATLCRSRQQLAGISTIVILTMSAIGGSMFPRFLMSETMQKVGLVTFNAWALDGYLKVFWREAPLAALWPQVTVLVGLAAAFFGAARLVARRWEAA